MPHNLSLTVYFFDGTHSGIKIVRQIRFGTCYFLFESSEMIKRYRIYRFFKRTSLRIKNISQKSIFQKNVTSFRTVQSPDCEVTTD